MIADFLKQLRQLPYQDMMIVAQELTRELEKHGAEDTSDVAAALSAVAGMKLEDSMSTQQEHKILRELFSRKRSISVKEHNGGFTIQLDTLRGHMMHKDLKQGISLMLDTLVAAQALKGK